MRVRRRIIVRCKTISGEILVYQPFMRYNNLNIVKSSNALYVETRHNNNDREDCGEKMREVA
jgi:hypothetical protein